MTKQRRITASAYDLQKLQEFVRTEAPIITGMETFANYNLKDTQVELQVLRKTAEAILPTRSTVGSVG